MEKEPDAYGATCLGIILQPVGVKARLAEAALQKRADSVMLRIQAT